jgi:hypothetical protein
MSNFFDVAHKFATLTTEHGFKLPRKLWYPRLIALTRPIEDLFFCYLLLRLHKNEGALEATLWIGPVQRPDDGLQNLPANIQIPIGYALTVNESFFPCCESKVIDLLQPNTLSNFVSACQKQLATPSRINRRHEVYTEYLLPFFQRVLAEANYEREVLNHKKYCRAVIEKVFNALGTAQKDFFLQLGLPATVEKVWELCYIYSL